MKADVTGELAVIRGWRDAQAPSDTRDAMVAGFLWALALVTDQDVAELRAWVEAPRSSAFARPAGPPPSPSPGVDVVPPAVPPEPGVEFPPWPGLGIDRIPRTVEAGDRPLGRGRAFTTGPDGRPVALAASYAEMAAETAVEARGLLDDTGGPETGADVSASATT